MGLLATGLGAAYYFLSSHTEPILSQDELNAILGAKTEEQFLNEILMNLRAEYTTFYAHYSNLIREVINLYGEQHELVATTIKEVMERLEEKIVHTEKQICETFKINRETLMYLIEKHDTEEVKTTKRLVKSNKARIMAGQSIDFELPFPREITKELYVELITKVLSDYREEAKSKVQEFYSTGQTTMTVEERNSILASIDGLELRDQVLQEFNIDYKNQKATEVSINIW